MYLLSEQQTNAFAAGHKTAMRPFAKLLWTVVDFHFDVFRYIYMI